MTRVTSSSTLARRSSSTSPDWRLSAPLPASQRWRLRRRRGNVCRPIVGACAMLRGRSRPAPPACEAHTIMDTPGIMLESETPDRSLGLAGGKLISVRAAVPSDAGRLQAYVRGLSGKARHNRFLGSISELTPAQLERIIRMNRPHALALLAFAPADLDRGPIGEAML